MQQGYRRQAAIAACSRTLLYATDVDAVPTALETLLDATGGVCAAVDLYSADDGGRGCESVWRSCRANSEHSDPPGQLWDVGMEIHAALSEGRTFVATVTSCTSNEELATRAHVPVLGSRGLLATLTVTFDEVREWSKPDLQLVRVGAEMLGVFLDQQAARDELELLSRSKDELIASVSHELRTPLTVIVGLAEELSDRLPQFTVEETAELIELILRQGQDISNIVVDLLVAARASIGVLNIACQDVKVHEEIHSFAIDAAGPDFGDLEISAEPTIARVDPARLRQILRNLVTNAVRYGGAHIVIRSEATDKGVKVTVSDDGPGIPDHLRGTIWEPFTSAHGDTTRPSAVGIGLTVSRELARLMDGDLHYRYEAGRSVFELTLPAGNAT